MKTPAPRRILHLLGALALVSFTVPLRAQPPHLTVPDPVDRMGWSRPCRELIDLQADGTIDLRVDLDYSAAGSLLSEVQDDDGDGTPDQIIRYTYDDRGRLVAVETDLGADDSVDARVRYRFEGDRLVAEELDEEGDGSIEEWYEFLYDHSGRWVTELRRDREGAVVQRIDLSHDQEGRVIEERMDVEADGSVELTVTYVYTGENLRAIQHDLDGDGELDIEARFLYGPNRRLVLEEWESDRLDLVRSRTVFRYDTDARLIEEEYDAWLDGTIDARVTYQYHCVI